MADNEGLFTEDVIINEEDLECNKVGVPNITETQNPNQDIQELDKEIQKPKKPRTEKQKEALKKAQLKRKENLAIKKAEKEALKNNPPIFKEPEPEPEVAYAPNQRRGRKPKIIYEDDESSDEEVIIMKRKPKKKKKVKRKIIVEPSESETSSSEDEVIVKDIQKPKRKYNKKVSLNVPDSDEEDEAYQYEYYEQKGPLKYSDVFRVQ